MTGLPPAQDAIVTRQFFARTGKIYAEHLQDWWGVLRRR